MIILLNQVENGYSKVKFIKTHSGAHEVRVMHGILADVANVLAGLSYSDKRKDKAGLFQRSLSQHIIDRGVTGSYVQFKPSTGASYLDRFYNRFLNKYGDEIRAEQHKISPHQFRHTFTSIAIRKFDGRVLPALRKHFLHSEASNFTKRYTDGKLTDKVKNELEREYINELVSRIATSTDQHEFVGGVVFHIKDRIKRMLGNNHQILSIEEHSNEIEQIANEFDSIQVHEYGYCMPSITQKGQAKCLNPKTNIPNPKQFSSFSVCSSCPNNLTLDSQAEAITRLAIAHNDFIKKYPIDLKNKAVLASENAVKNAERILSNLGKK